MKMITSPHILGGEDKKGSKCKGDDEILTPFKTELGSLWNLTSQLVIPGSSKSFYMRDFFRPRRT